jgi:hypothetical protein
MAARYDERARREDSRRRSVRLPLSGLAPSSAFFSAGQQLQLSSLTRVGLP